MASVITTTGFSEILENGYANFGWFAVGTGTPTVAVGTNALTTELTRKATTSKTVTGAALALEVLYVNSEANGTLTEYGLFDASTGGNCLMIGNLDSIVKASNKQLSLTATATFSNA